MTLSAEELAAAQKAYTQNREYVGKRRYLLLVAPMMILYFGLSIFDKWKEGHIGVLIFDFALMVVILLLYTRLLSRMRELKSRYADNQRLLEELKQKYGAGLPAGIHTDVLEEHPLLESWNRRLEKRALLWRLDAFLSRKQVSA